MSDARWADIEADATACVHHFGNAVRIYRAGGLLDDTMDGYTRRMAFMHAMHAGHTSLEKVLLRILEMQGEETPTGRQWHADLLSRTARPGASRPAVLPPDLFRAADRTRKFRHFAAHAYDSFEVEDADPAVRAADIVASGFASAIAAYRNGVDP